MLYTDAMRREVHKIKVPAHFRMDIVEYDDDPSFLFVSLRFYFSEWRTLTDHEKIKCVEYMESVRKVLRGYGVSTTIEPIYDLPG